MAHLLRSLAIALVITASAPGQALSHDKDDQGKVYGVSYQGTSDWLAKQTDPRSHLHKLPDLDTVALNNHQISRAAMSYICGLKNLKYLEVGSSPEGVFIDSEALAMVGNAKSLEELRLVKFNLRDEDLSFLPKLKNLYYLEIEGTTDYDGRQRDQLTDKAAEYVAQTASLEELRIGRLWGLVPDSFVAGLSKHPKLQLVSIRSDAQWTERENEKHFSDVGVAKLATSKSLDSVSLHSPALTAKSLHALLSLPKLKDLYLSVNKVDANDLAAVAKAPSLESLLLPKAAPTDEMISKLSGHPSLRRLSFDGSNLTVASRKVLESLKKLEQVGLPGAPAALLKRGGSELPWTTAPKKPEILPPGITRAPQGEEILPPGVSRK